MPPQARLGDKAFVPADSHGCPACPHTATGPAIGGSPNVFVNGRPAIRVDDPGIHAACCGPNTWNAKTGSRSVFINGRAAHRLGDMVKHCGGMGNTVEGSPNVFVGDLSAGSAKKQSMQQPKKQLVMSLKLVDPFGNPLEQSFLDAVVCINDQQETTISAFIEHQLDVEEGTTVKARFTLASRES